MKRFVFILTMSLVAAAALHARVGETEEEIAVRYGKGKKATEQRIAGAVTSEYRKDGFYVEVVILDGKSIMEIYAHEKETTDDVIKELLKVNSTREAAWHLSRKTNRWERGGTPKLVAYRWPGHPEFFCIKDLKACDDAEKKNKPTAGGL